MVLRPPVEPMLAQARDTVPAPGALPGRLVFQPKFDGYQALLFTGPVRLRSRRGSLIHARFPELVHAAADLPEGLMPHDRPVAVHLDLVPPPRPGRQLRHQLSEHDSDRELHTTRLRSGPPPRAADYSSTPSSVSGRQWTHGGT
ncbi:hypothetical protein [Streptomyces sp. NPDC049915]|uniref:hypothetical protein n=1 Tax=Streptomyces sp. NPDC049915 TaxID=3155510 RepID=UPI00344915A7